MVRAAAWPRAIREAGKLGLVHGVEDRHRRSLDDLVLQCRYANRALLAIPAPAPLSHAPDPVFGAWWPVASSAWPAAFPPVPPPPASWLCSGPSSALRGCLTSQARTSAACVCRLPAALQRPCIGGAAWRGLGSPGSRARCFRACAGSPTP